jgi:hypothetical protein
MRTLAVFITLARIITGPLLASSTILRPFRRQYQSSCHVVESRSCLISQDIAVHQEIEQENNASQAGGQAELPDSSL